MWIGKKAMLEARCSVQRSDQSHVPLRSTTTSSPRRFWLSWIPISLFVSLRRDEASKGQITTRRGSRPGGFQVVVLCVIARNLEDEPSTAEPRDKVLKRESTDSYSAIAPFYLETRSQQSRLVTPSYSRYRDALRRRAKWRTARRPLRDTADATSYSVPITVSGGGGMGPSRLGEATANARPDASSLPLPK